MVTVWKRLISFQQYDKARLPAEQVILLKVGATPGYALGTPTLQNVLFKHSTEGQYGFHLKREIGRKKFKQVEKGFLSHTDM